MVGIGFKSLRSQLERRYLRDRGYGSGREFGARLVASVGPGDVLLDAGCGEGRLRQEVPGPVYYIGMDRYVGAQKNEYATWIMRPTVLADIHQLPLADSSCKTVALLHVLEHTHEPTKLLAEVSRALQPGGFLFVDVPFLHEIHHAPHDYFRYTPFSLRRMAETAGLRTEEIRPSGGYFRALSHLLEPAPIVICGSTAGDWLTRLVIAYPLSGLGWLIRKLQYLLDLQDESQTFSCGYHCIFNKPSDGRG